MENKKTTFGKRFLAMVIALAMMIGLLPAYGFAAQTGATSAMTDKVADPSTVNAYKDLLGAFSDGNRYAGRLWTDKSVFSDFDALKNALGSELTQAQLEQLGMTPEEFMVVYSALGSTTSVFTETVVSSNLDVVIVLDNSGSMRSTVTDANGNRVTRLQAVVGAANKLIDGILENPSNRLALVAYSADSSLLLDLDCYAQTDSCLSNSGGRLTAQADSLTDSSAALQGYSITAHQTGTNVQSGINAGMKILNEAQNTEGRTPVLIVMTDGAANYAAYRDMLGDTSGDGNYKQPSSSTTADIALSTLLNAAYWKYTVSQKYGTKMKAFTVGVDIDDLEDASIVVNPGDFFNATSTAGFSDVALDMLELYTEWSESSSAVSGSTAGRGNSRYTWTFPQPATEALKEGIEKNIVYSDEYYEVNSEKLAGAFDDILVKISSMQDAFQVIEKTDITNGESSMAYVDFIGDYMELKNFQGISLYGAFYTVALKSTSTTNNSDGTVTVNYAYTITGSDTVTDPLTGESFRLSENVAIDLKHTYKVDASGNRTSAGEQDLWIHIDEQVLPLVYHKISTENETTTYTIYDEVPVRFFYTVGVSEFVAPAGNLLLYRIDAQYLAANTGANGEVYFYANQYYAQDDDETLVNHTKESGHGDAHTAITPDASNRYYIHQYNVPIYTSITDANGQAVTMDPGAYGVEFNASYTTKIMTYADLAGLTDSTRLYTQVHFHAPTGRQTGTTSDGGAIYAGAEKTYFFFADWGNMLNDVAFYDSVNGVYINADGSTSATEGKWNSNYTYEQYISIVAAYIAATGVRAEDVHAYMAIGSWRIQRFANRTFEKTENPTDTAALRIAPVLNSDDETEHEGSIVIWLGNNGRVGYTAQTPKTVTDASGNDIDGQLVVIGDVLTYTITATNYEDGPATIVITDNVPLGTSYVTGSADNNGVYAGGKLTWTLANVAVGETVTVSYRVKVTGENMAVIENTAYITIGNNPAYESNTTKNPPVGKTSSSSGTAGNGQVQVGDVLTYTIYYHNNTDAAAEIKIFDTIPAGTTYVEGSASYHGTDALQLTQANGAVTALNWTISQVPAGQSGSVHFQVRVNADAENPVENAAEITVGDNNPVVITNNVVNELAYGDLTLRKTVAAGNAAGNENQYFTLHLQSAIEGVSVLNGSYTVSGSSAQTSVTFTNGAASLQIKHGESVTIHGLPAGITVTVYEQTAPGYTAVYSSDFVNIVANETAVVEITNVYNVTPATVTLVGNKVLTGMQLDADMFSFVVYDAQGNVVAGATNAADGSITFSALHFAAAGTYTYTVKETNTGAEGVTYDKTVYTVEIKVEDDGNGKLTASVTYPQGGLKFTNVYTPKEVTVTLEGNKLLSGAAADGIAAGEFSFDVYAYDIATGAIGGLVSAGTTAEGQNSAAIIFAPIGFTLADLTDDQGNILQSKDFWFLVAEDIPAENGPAFDPNMAYDSHQFLAMVTVTYDATTGVLSVSEPTYSIPGGSQVSIITFFNVQNAASVEVRPVGNKTTTNAPSDDLTFSFSVINKETGVEAGVGVGKANGEITFTTLSFSQPGTYTYIIRESNADNKTNGITYDEAEYTMTVVVTRDKVNKLIATVSYADENGASVSVPSFVNKYEANGFINLTAKKQLNGRDLVDGEFAFKLVRQDNGGEIDGIAAANGTITFATMYYSREDIPAGQSSATIHYVMSEINTGLAGVVYDTTPHDVYVTIVDNGDGTIRAFLSDASGNALTHATETGITFTNTYGVTSGAEVNIEVEKDLTGRDLRPGEFTFVLYRYDGQNGWKNVASTLNEANGAVEFLRQFNADTLGHLSFEADGTYTVLYRIDEVNNHLGGVQYDASSIYVKVVIFHDVQNASYTIRSVGYYSDEACQNVLTEPKFENSYSASGTSLVPQANKVLTGHTLEAGEFSFVITDSNGDVVSYGTNDANGNIHFGALSFTAAGEYTFTVQEVEGKLGGITYDTTTHTFTVKVVDNGDGTLTATATYPNGGITFNNVYNAKPVTVYPGAMKELDGKTLVDGEFTFELAEKIDGQFVVIDTATNDATGLVAFQPITYTQPGIYEYKIYEQAGSDSRYTYSSSVYEITVTVTDDGNGNLYASYQIKRNDVEVGGITFYNQFTPDPVYMDLNDALTFHKVMDDQMGTGFSPAGFEFHVYNWNGELVATGISDSNGNIDFEPDLQFTEAGEYHFRVQEISGNEFGVTYDPSTWIVTVNVGFDATSGLLKIDEVTSIKEGGSNQSTHEIEFVNRYEVNPVDVQIRLNKVLVGRDLVAGEFVFFLLENDEVIDSATNDAEGNITFELTLDRVGVYTYKVVEVIGKNDRVTYDLSNKLVTVTVTHNDRTGKLEATVSMSDDTFVNTYAPEAGMLTLTARKMMIGRMLEDGEFTFLLTDESGNTFQATNNADGVVVFDTITYTETGTYVYTITELQGNAPGVAYSTRVYTATVTVTDNMKGQLVATVVYTYEDSYGVTQTIAEPLFANVYTTENGVVELTAKKVLNGRDLAEGEFTFVLTDEEGNETIATNDLNGNISFGFVTFTEAGTYTYTIREKNGALGGVTYSDLVYTVTVTVIDNGEGQLVAEAAYTLNGEAVEGAMFVNTYEAADVQVSLKAFKTLSGRTLKAGEFTFVLVDDLGNILEAVNDASGNVSFGTIIYTEAGTYTYTIREQVGSVAGVTYSDLVYTVTVTVTDDGEGQLVAEVAYALDGKAVEGATFVNTYKAGAVQVQLEAFKTLSGRTLKAEEFTFILTDANGNVEEVKNDVSGSVRFGAITYTEAGTYTYTIREKAGTLGGVTYSDLVYTVTVTVTDDGEGLLAAEVNYSLNGEAVEAAAFVNTYKAAEVQLGLEAFKTLTGRLLKADEFTFILADENGNILEAANDANGNVRFDAITYTETGIYTYTIREKAGSVAGVSYSDRIYTVTVTVTDDGEGQLVAEAVYSLAGEAVENVAFVNSYRPNPAELTLVASKVLEGKQLNAEVFTFLLTDENGNVLEAVNDANGNVRFDAITFAETGIYTYTIREKAGSVAGVTYSDLVYTVTVTVTDNGEGQLVAEAVYSLEGEVVEGTTFINIYQAAEVQLQLEAYKSLTGRMLKADEFTFLLIDANGNAMEATNDAEGNIRFDAITFTEAGTYTYTVREKAGALGGVTYSELVYTVTVTVTDNGEGQLVAEAVYSLAEEAVEAITFVNSYVAAGTEITLVASKVLEGKLLKAEEFTFILTDANGNILEATNDADGNVSFDAIAFTEAGTYTYTIREKAGMQGGITYSELVYTVTVTVTDNGEGQLVAEAVYSLAGEIVEGAAFVNTYEAAEVQLQLEAFKTLSGRMLKADEFTFLLTDANGNTLEATNDAEGNIRFGALTFTEAGTYVYAITEKAGEAGGVTYSNLVYVVTVIVTDNGEGQLVAEVIYELEGDIVENAVFVNSYAAGAASLTLEAIKTLEGKTLEEGAFTFVLTDENGNTVEATNAADGTIRFADLVFAEAGIYRFTLSEVKGEEVAMVYDETVYSILVTVVDNGNGALEIASVLVNDAAVTVTEGVVATGITFVNVFDPIPETGDRGIAVTMMLMSASITALVVLLLAEKNRRTNG